MSYYSPFANYNSQTDVSSAPLCCDNKSEFNYGRRIKGIDGEIITFSDDEYVLGTYKNGKLKPVSQNFSFCSEHSKCSTHSSPKDLFVELSAKNITKQMIKEKGVEFYLISKELNQAIIKKMAFVTGNDRLMPGENKLFTIEINHEDLPSNFQINDYELIFLESILEIRTNEYIESCESSRATMALCARLGNPFDR